MSDDINEYFEELFKIFLVGDSNVGKRQILNSYIKEFEKDVKNKIGPDFEYKCIYIEEKIIKFHIWDTAGEEKFKSLTKNYYKGAHGIFVVYDITNQESFDSVEYWFKEINEIDAETSLIGNKCDLCDERKIEESQGKEKALSFGSVFYEISAAKKINIDKIFFDLMNRIYEKYKQSDNSDIEDLEENISINKYQSEKYQNCCY